MICSEYMAPSTVSPSSPILAFQEAHFEEVVVKAIDAHWFDEASWTVAESQAREVQNGEW